MIFNTIMIAYLQTNLWFGKELKYFHFIHFLIHLQIIYSFIHLSTSQDKQLMTDIFHILTTLPVCPATKPSFFPIRISTAKIMPRCPLHLLVYQSKFIISLSFHVHKTICTIVQYQNQRSNNATYLMKFFWQSLCKSRIALSAQLDADNSKRNTKTKYIFYKQSTTLVKSCNRKPKFASEIRNVLRHKCRSYF